MKKWLLLGGLVALALAFALVFLSLKGKTALRPGVQGPSAKTVILSFALVADSENENDLLAKALKQAQGMGINFVVGLGDWTQVGTEAELSAVKKVFDEAKIPYYLVPGDHDLWDSRNTGKDALTNYKNVFGDPNGVINRENVQIILVDNSDIYKGIREEGWSNLNESLSRSAKLRFVMSHKVPFHPESKHVMGEENAEVAKQAKDYLDKLEGAKIDGFFSGDMHFFAQYKTEDGVLKITTVGSIASEKNFQGPRFAIVRVYSDYTWDVEDVEIR